MAAKSSPSDSVNRSEPPKDASMTEIEENTPDAEEVLSVIDSLKKQVTADRSVSVKVKA
ncbi:hypothetical protein COLO4_00184 [Corchorus olitorius]|uniref:Uncharacterized protein n=1 Tax=Corchorus olitorius TaxID=93759 RepID=A0A1R3L4D5_9ROSI|nr:hypothetical protein COLO4_00184 [Corchorus olitorius]